MSLFTWQPKYSVHHPKIDEQHRGLFRAADDLHSAMLRGAGKQVIAKTLTALLDYTRDHFRDEESLMRSSGFAAYPAHKTQHDDFTRQVAALKESLEKGECTITVQTMTFLGDWLKNHIMGLDVRIARHLETTSAAKAS